MTSLTDAQTAVLATAAGASDGVIDRDGDPRTIASLIKKGCLIALPNADGPGRLLITTAGREALGHADDGVKSPATITDNDDQATESLAANRFLPSPTEPPLRHDEPDSSKHEPTGPSETSDEPTFEPSVAKPLPKGKVGALIELLSRPAGASVEAMMEATGWQAHSIRGAMSGAIKKTRGFAITSEKTDAGRTYRIKSESAA